MKTTSRNRLSSEKKPKAKGSATTPVAESANRVTVRNPNAPDYVSTVDAVMYSAMKQALRKSLPRQAPGMTQAEMLATLTPHLPTDLFPGGAKAGWWMKCVQLDLETRGDVVREQTKPLRWHMP